MNDQTERLLGFSDAVFAIAMTFLALDLGAVPRDVGEAGGPTASEYLAEQAVDYGVYFLTFLVVGFLWWRHHLMFRFIKRTNVGVRWVNTLMLALVAILPYPASVVSEAPHLGLALAMLLVPLALIGLLMWLEFEIAVRCGLVIPGLPPQYVNFIRAQVIASPVILSAAALLALYSAATDNSTARQIAVGMWVLLIIVPLVLRRWWPVPAQEYAVATSDLPSDWRSVEDSAADEAHRVRTLLGRLRNGSDTDRILVLTDGVVAIAVTILALQLRPPATDGEITNEVLLQNLASVPAWTYFMTFILISLFWRGHIRIFTFLKGADPVVLWLNLIFLMFISFLPAAAALQSRDEGTVSESFYLGVMALAATALAVLGQYGSRAKNLAIDMESPLDHELARFRAYSTVAAFVIALVCVNVFQAPVWSNVVWVVLIVAGRYSHYRRNQAPLSA